MKHAVFLLVLAAGAALADTTLPTTQASTEAAATATATATATEQELGGQARAHGSLIAMAQFCKVSDDTVSAFARKLEQETMLAAKGVPFKFDADRYMVYAKAGFKSTAELLAYMPSSGESYKSNCAAVREKVAAAMAK